MSPDRPIGFSPAEVSALVNRHVLVQHADEAGFLWTLREAGTRQPHFTLEDVAALDERVAAHLDGLGGAFDAAWEICIETASAGDAGALFATSVLAFDSGSRERMADAVRVAVASSKTWSPLVSALGWLEFDRVSQWIRMLLEARSPAHRAIAVAAYAVHRRDPGDAPLRAGIDSEATSLRQRALRAVGELKRTELRNALRDHFDDDDEDCRFWSAWSAALLGDRQGVATLFEIAESAGLRCDAALQLALRTVSPEEGASRIGALARQSRTERAAVLGAGIVGDPAHVPWIIARMEDPELARAAGEAFEMITGADIALDDLELDESNEAEGDASGEEPDLGSDENLPAPSVPLVAAWWDAHQESFRPGQRYLIGRPVNQANARHVLQTGRQRQRAAAALELALLEPDEVLFEVRAPARRQRQQLATWTS